MMKKFTLFVAIFLGFLTNSNAQIGLLETFNASTTIPTGWTNPNFYGGTSSQACNGNSVRKNLYSGATTAVLTTPNYPGASNGTDITFSFDYKVVNWSAATVATPAGWGSSFIEVSTDDGVTWVTKYTIDNSNHVVANTCANVSFTIPGADVPSGSDLKFRFRNTWSAGDYYFYIDNVSASQVTATPPNCDAALTSPADGATDANIFGNITWSAATGVATGYNLTVGTTSGGSDVLATTDVANVGGYALGSLSFETTYYVSIVPYNTNGNATGCTEYSFTTVPAPEPGNLCQNPIEVTLPYETTDDTANYSDIYYEGAPGSSCGSTSGYLNGNDVVYAYTSTTDGSINVNLTNVGTYTGLFAYASCSSIGSSCIGGVVNGFAGGPLSLMEFPVVTGETYYFVISTWASPQTTAYTLSIVENTCTNATATYTVVSDCANGEQFLVDVDVTSLGTATSLTVTDDQGSAPQTVSATGIVQFGPYQNATPVVFTVSNDQDSNCVITSPSTTQAVCPPANDLCSGAIDLGLETSPLDGTTVGANNNNIPTCGGTTAAPDVYYSISVPSGSTLTIQQTANSYDSVVSMFYGDCSTPTAITCYDDSDTLITTWANTTGSDQTVYFVVDGYNGTSGTFTLDWSVVACANATATYTVVSDCANGEQFLVDVNVTNLGSATSVTVSDDQGSAPQTVSAAGTVQFGPFPNGTPVIFTVANDQDAMCTVTSAAQSQAVCPPNCDNATVIANCDEEVVADMVAGAGSWNVNSCGFTTSGTELVYSFTPATTGVYSLEVTAATGFAYIDYFYKVANGTCDNTGWTCIDDNSGVGTDLIGELTAGVEYLFLLDGEGTTAKNQTFKITCPPTCTDATVTYTVVSDCANGPQFLVDVNITDLGTATSITVSDDQGSATQNVTATGTVQFGPFPNGTPVIFTVANDQDGTCVLTSSPQSQAVCPPNCSEATVIECGTDTVADFIAGSGAWNVNACGFSTAGVENIYSFTAPADGTYSLEVTAATGGYVDYFFKVASGSCDNTGWTCIDDVSSAGTASIGALTAGTEYLILLDSEGTTARNQTFKVVCPLVCVEPTATFAVVSNCAVAAQFFVTANITNLGSATSMTVSDNQASATQNITAAGTVQFGPYANGTSVVLTLTNDQLTTCTLVSAAQTQADCPPSCATLTTPANGATNVAFTTPGVISLAWTAPVTGPAPTNYTIMWGPTATTMVSLGNTPNTAVNITGVPYNTTFYWSAVPNFTSGSVTDCAVFSFTTAGSPGYCLNGEQWPATTFVPSCTGGTEVIESGAYAGEYSRVTVTSGITYTFTSSVATDFITIGNAAGTTAIVYGTTPLTWTSDLDGDIRFYTHLSDQCGFEAVDRTRALSCTNLATDTFDNANFTYKPNPVVDVLNLEYNKTITSVAIYNLVGQQVIAKTVNANMSQVDMSALPTGTYMVKVTSNNEVKTIKVVKQ